MPISDIGRYHLEDNIRDARLSELRTNLGLEELMYLSTCNRVEFIFCTEHPVNDLFLARFFRCFRPEWNATEIGQAMNQATLLEGETAVRHLFEVAASLDSLVVGEREIITQVRNAYETSNRAGLTGDTIRLAIKKTIETAKAVYTETHIARNPVSVVSLAYRRLRELNAPLDARLLFIGAGVTNTAMARYLEKHGFRNFTVFNRTLANAEKLAGPLEGKAFALNALDGYRGGFDIMITCTGAEETIITKEIYKSLIGNDRSRKIVIDLAVPNDLDPALLEEYDINLIAVNNLQEVAVENLKEREKELVACNAIIERSLESFRTEYRTRLIERAMSEVPRKVKEIRDNAVNSVFAREIGQLDEPSKELLDRVMAYFEKKYISVPMKMAKDILLEDARRN